MNSEKTGRFIQELRKENNMTQAELAEKILVSDKAVSRWETGRGFPDIDNLEALSECLGVTAAELIKGERLPEEVSKEELGSISAESMFLTKMLLNRRRYFNVFLGFILSLGVLILAIVHLTSPIYIKDAGDALNVEELSDGRLVATISEEAAGYDVYTTEWPVGLKVAFISCYTTRWQQITGKRETSMALIGNSSEIDEIYYYPTTAADQRLYKREGSVEMGGSIVTLPRLTYNYWIVIGILLSALGIAACLVFRKRYFSGILMKITALPVAFTLSILLCIMGNMGEVYNAGFYLTGILLLTVVIYAVLFMLILRKRK